MFNLLAHFTLIIDKCIECHPAICQLDWVTNTIAVIQPTLYKSHGLMKMTPGKDESPSPPVTRCGEYLFSSWVATPALESAECCL